MYSNETVKKEADRFVHFENLPDVILFKIFSYLYVDDLCRAGRVCLRWYHISRCQVLWKHVDTHDMQLTQHQVLKFIKTLPSCVLYLRMSSLSTQHRIPFITPRTAVELRERLPLLQTLILESAYIAKHIHFTDITVEDLPPNLSVLSLRKSFFHTDQFFCGIGQPTVPKISVLDCSHCWCICDYDIPFFSRLGHLQEIYLSNCPISDKGMTGFLKVITNIKVVDVEHTQVSKETMLTIQQFCPSLEKLYLSFTGMDDEQLCLLSAASSPNLQVLCLRNTRVTVDGLAYLVKNIPSLKHVYVTSTKEVCCIEAINMALRRVIHVEKYNEGDIIKHCDHFYTRDNSTS